MKKLKEALATDTKSGQDFLGRAETTLLSKLLPFKSFPFMNQMDTDIRNAVTKTATYFQDNDVPENIQSLWLKSVGDFGQIVHVLAMVAASYAASQKDKKSLPELQQKAIARFNSSPMVTNLDNELRQLKTSGVDISEYEKILENSVKNVINNIFGLKFDDLYNFINILNVSPDMKKKMIDTVKSNEFFSQGENIASARTAQVPKMQLPQNPQTPKTRAETETQISPENAQKISAGFRQYMDSLKKDYGVSGVQLLGKEIQNYLQSLGIKQ